MATFTGVKGPCPSCGSSDANAHYDDGSTFCFSCRKATRGDGESVGDEDDAARERQGFITSSPQDISNRALRETVCAKYGYGIGEYQGEKCHVANYREPGSGKLLAQKIRRTGKRFSIVGDGKALPFFGQHLFHGGKSVVITEGEIDCLSVATAFGDGKWPVVSLPNGAQSALKAVKAQYEWLNSFEKVVLCFDQDDVGRAAQAEVAALLPPGKAFIMTLNRKDPNEVLKEDGIAALTSAFWNASPWRPDGIRKLSDIREEAKAPIKLGLPWAFPSLTKGTFGRRPRELYTFGAGTGVGKTDVFTQQIEFDIVNLKEGVGVFFLEQDNVETVRRLAGKLMGKPFHIPDTGTWEQGDYEAAVDLLADTDLVYLYNHFGQSDWDTIKSRIRFLNQNHGVRLIYLDHLTALADPAKERESLEQIMADIASMTQELGLIFHLVSHLSTPSDGKSHEEGGRVMLRHFKGARAIGFWTNYAFGLERDKGHEDRAQRNVTTIRCVKDRYTGQFDGETFYISYDRATTRLTECEPGFLAEAELGPSDAPL